MRLLWVTLLVLAASTFTPEPINAQSNDFYEETCDPYTDPACPGYELYCDPVADQLCPGYIEETCDPYTDPTCPDYELYCDPIADQLCPGYTEPTCDPLTDPTCDGYVDPTCDPLTDPTCDGYVGPTCDPLTDPTCDGYVGPACDPLIDPTCDGYVEPTCNPITDPSCDGYVEPACNPVSDPTCDGFVDPTAQAREAAGGVNIAAGLTQENVEDVVEPYETSAPPESGLTGSTIENAIDERLLDQDDVGTQGHQDLVDSNQLRPEYTLDRDSDLNRFTQAIIDGAGTTAGDLFTETGTGVCTEDTFENVPMFEAFCERTSVFDTQTCQVDREITTDRKDVFLCDIAPDHIERACDQELRILCADNPNCMADTLNLRKTSVTRGDDWSGYGFKNGQADTIKGATATHLKARFNWFLEFWGPAWEHSWPQYWSASTRTCWNNKYTMQFNVPANVNITALSATGLKGHETFKMAINGQTVFNNGPKFAGHNCYKSASLVSHPDVNLLPHMQAGTNTITIDHISGHVGHVEFFLLHDGACCQNPQEYYEEVSCRE